MERQNSENQSSAPDENSMDTVRELLFGKQTNELSDRIDELESNLRAATKAEEERVNHRIDTLENFLKDEVTALSSRMQDLDAKLGATEEKTRSTIHDRAKAQSEEISRVRTELSQRIETEISALRSAAADQAEFASAIIELGMHLHPNKGQTEDRARNSAALVR
ncbi:MAG: hypothetical protein AAF226_03665 [Verrucomicrobiota bacterium]